jgi:hypothetical protein
MTRISLVAAALLSSLALFGCSSTMSDSDRAMVDQARQDANSARASAAAAKQSADAARSAEMAARQSGGQTAAAPAPSRTSDFRNAQRK